MIHTDPYKPLATFSTWDAKKDAPVLRSMVQLAYPDIILGTFKYFSRIPKRSRGILLKYETGILVTYTTITLKIYEFEYDDPPSPRLYIYKDIDQEDLVPWDSGYQTHKNVQSRYGYARLLELEL